ncbi:hypothetical protein SAMN02910265_00328 [Ruminococcus flavefaciens]|uniref:Uncharacterized protein n=1 Tax=Ruminococcus flavefaciens TaxID=1265 RepID=A0A1H6HZ73_RUMFL|nr:hypothetical protein [Ruminococcus flavefaciens]SEH39478.1 hypothetical protein SAMN02910265_00328 [Ruminococcus flavefaciens]
MKNVIKKITAAAMAFTILGAGSVITNNSSSKANKTFTAKAYMPPQYCNHNCGIHGVYGTITIDGMKYKVGYCNNCGSPGIIKKA